MVGKISAQLRLAINKADETDEIAALIELIASTTEDDLANLEADGLRVERPTPGSWSRVVGIPAAIDAAAARDCVRRIDVSQTLRLLRSGGQPENVVVQAGSEESDEPDQALVTDSGRGKVVHPRPADTELAHDPDEPNKGEHDIVENIVSEPEVRSRDERTADDNVNRHLDDPAGQ